MDKLQKENQFKWSLQIERELKKRGDFLLKSVISEKRVDLQP